MSSERRDNLERLISFKREQDPITTTFGTATLLAWMAEALEFLLIQELHKIDAQEKRAENHRQAGRPARNDRAQDSLNANPV